MAHVNAFVEVGNEHRRVSVGGRGANDETWGWFNCATASGERAMRVSAEVYGTTRSQDRRKLGSDTRTVTFTVELPEPGEHVKVRIREANARMGDLVKIGGMLCALKGAQQIEAGEVEQGQATIEKAAEIVAEMESNLPDLPEVELPGGITLKHALACCEFVKRLTAGQVSDN